MKNQFRFLLGAVLTVMMSSCHVGRFFVWNFADADDNKKFDEITIENSGTPFQFVEVLDSNGLRLPDSLKWYKRKGSTKLPFEEALLKSNTMAFMVIRNDSILYENYMNGMKESDLHPSFSAGKSFVSMLVGIAIGEGKIKSVNDPITEYIPELRNGRGFEKITIEHLLDMRSGIKFNEGYFNPFGNVAKFYYGKNIKKYIPKLKIKEDPNIQQEYVSINTQLLSLILENATGVSTATYLEEKVWKHLGMEYPASWSIDSEKNQTVKAFCCLNARARDFAKLGRLYLNEGNWEGRQIIPSDWVKASTTYDTVKNHFGYSYQWWTTRLRSLKTDSTKYPDLFYQKQVEIEEDGVAVTKDYIYSHYGDFYAMGFLGQYIYMYPKKDLIIVRLGDGDGRVYWQELFWDIVDEN
ncbi:MAG: serine hydrolase [Ekhidna sp.]|nr:serine hydrolase [Ekhidna sp.]